MRSVALATCIGFGIDVSTINAQGNCAFERVDARGHTREEFNQKHRYDKPFVLTNAQENWRARYAWQRANFLSRFGDFKLAVKRQLFHVPLQQVGDDDLVEDFVSVRNYIEDDRWNEFIQFDYGNSTLHHMLAVDHQPIHDTLYDVYELPVFSLGKKNTGYSMHQHEEQWVAQVTGRSVWMLAERGFPKRSIPESKLPCAVYESPPEGIQLCEVGPGEIIFVPDYWYHGFCHLDDFVLGVGGRGDSSTWPQHFHDIIAGDIESLKNLSSGQLKKMDKHGHQAIHMAAREGHLAIVQYLHEVKHINPRAQARGQSNMQGHHENTKNMGWFDWFYHTFLADSFVVPTRSAKRGGKTGSQALHLAAGSGHLAVVEYLVQHFVDVNAEGEDGQSPLHWALSSDGDVMDVVRYLIDHNASIAMGSRDAAVTTFYAIKRANLHILEYMVEKGLDVHRSLYHGEHAIHLSAEIGHVTVTNYLLDHGCSVNELASDGTQPLHYAARGGHVKIIELLAKHGMNVRASDRLGMGPAHMAAQHGHLKGLQVLADSKADLTERSSGKGERPIHLAKSRGHTAVIEFLENWKPPAPPGRKNKRDGEL